MNERGKRESWEATDYGKPSQARYQWRIPTRSLGTKVGRYSTVQHCIAQHRHITGRWVLGNPQRLRSVLRYPRDACPNRKRPLGLSNRSLAMFRGTCPRPSAYAQLLVTGTGRRIIYPKGNVRHLSRYLRTYLGVRKVLPTTYLEPPFPTAPQLGLLRVSELLLLAGWVPFPTSMQYILQGLKLKYKC
jgi:hypothetical protein